MPDLKTALPARVAHRYPEGVQPCDLSHMAVAIRSFSFAKMGQVRKF
jgi:hypothetical protein